VLSQDDTYGNADDLVIGEYRRNGALEAGASYTRNERFLLPPATTGRYKLFVVSDARSEVFENGADANNTGRLEHAVDVMPIPYADLQVESVTTTGTASSGRPLRLTWTVANRGIASTNTHTGRRQRHGLWLRRPPWAAGRERQLHALDRCRAAARHRG
jgi:hypothetical protein